MISMSLKKSVELSQVWAHILFFLERAYHPEITKAGPQNDFTYITSLIWGLLLLPEEQELNLYEKHSFHFFLHH